MNVEPKHPVKSAEKTLSIIDALHELEGAGITELSRHLGYSKATVHHHLSTLEANEYVVNRDDRYQLGIRLFELGQFTRREIDLFEIAKPEVDSLAERTGEIANLMFEEHGRGIYLYIARGEQAVHLDTHIGTRQYLHTSASGKSILSHLPQEHLESIIDRHGLPSETENTVTDVDHLRSELNEIRTHGVAFDGEERAEGIRCVAAPILDNQQTLLGAVSVSAPSVRMQGDWFKEEVPELVKKTAKIIGINASYS